MVLQRLLSLLLNNPQLIQRLSETRPIREAARFTAYLFLKSKHMAEEQAQKTSPQQMSRFRDTFQEEVRKGLKDLNKSRKSKP